MDAISWTVALVAGLTLPSLGRAVALGLATSIAIRFYQYFVATPQQWGTFPEDLFGATAMLLLTAVMAWIGSVIRIRRQTREVTE